VAKGQGVERCDHEGYDRGTRWLDGDLGLFGLREDVADEVRRRRADDPDRPDVVEREGGLARGTGTARRAHG
jgi:hypothetical protein